MIYLFECKNKKCKNFETKVEVPLSPKGDIKADCKSCDEDLKRIYTVSSIKTGDGVKYG